MSIGELFGESDNPLSQEERQQLHELVVATARRSLVCRRFIDLFGPLGAGVQAVPYLEFGSQAPGSIDLAGDADNPAVSPSSRSFKTLPIIYKDFLLHWRDIQAAHDHNLPLDLSAAAVAAAFCAQKEDELIFFGDKGLGVPGLLTAEGRLVASLGRWDEPGGGLASVVAATERLAQEGFFAPYVLVTSPRLFALLHRVHERTGVLEVETVRAFLGAGVYRSNLLRGDLAVLVAVGPQNLDLAIAVDLTVAHLGPDKLNHPFRVLEVVMPRIKRPKAICTLEPGA